MNPGILRILRKPLNNCLQDMVDILGLDGVIMVFSKNNGLEPKNTYGVVDILNVRQHGKRDEGVFMNCDDQIEFVTHNTLDIQIQFIGADSQDAAYDFFHGIKNNMACIDRLRYNNFGLTLTSNVRRVPQPRESTFVDAYSMDLSVTFGIMTRQSYDWIEYITLDGEVLRLPNSQQP